MENEGSERFMNYCPNCGEPVNEGAKFCPKCGQNLEATTGAASLGKAKAQWSQFLTDESGELLMEQAEGLEVTRGDLKEAAQRKLSGRYGEWLKTILWYLVVVALSSVFLSVALGKMAYHSFWYNYGYGYGYGEFGSGVSYVIWLLLFLVVFVFLFLVSTLFQAVMQWCSIFTLKGQRADGVRIFRYMIRSQKNRVLKANVLTGIYTFLWSLLLVIPGIVKGASYAMTNYLLEKEPDITVSEAISKSRKIMHGYKLEFLILRYSFYLWWLVMSLSAGLAGFYVLPYQNVTEMKFLDLLYQKYQEKQAESADL